MMIKYKQDSTTKDSTNLLNTPQGSTDTRTPRTLEIISFPYLSVSAASHVSKPTHCKLAVLDTETGNYVIVADGTAYPYGSTTVIHNEEIRADHYYKVSVDEPYLEPFNIQLPCVSKDGETAKVGQAKGHFLEWPKDLVIFLDENEDMCRGKGIQTLKSIVGSTAAPRDENENHAGNHDDCQALAQWLNNASDQYASPVITIAPPLFYYTIEPHYSSITRVDLEEFLKGDSINVSILHVYQLFLMEEYADIFDQLLVSLLCPAKLSADIAKKQPTKYRDYLRDAFMLEKDKGDKQCKFLLAPYNEGDHWLLMVIELQAGQVYVFNSIRNDNIQSLRICPNLNITFKIYKANGGKCTESRSKELCFSVMKCAQQPGGVECGYYTMKFMHEIVSLYSDCNNLKDEYYGTRSPYAAEEINVVRAQWAKYFRHRWIEI